MHEWGVPAHITTDRGTAFTAAGFKEFLKKLGVRHHLNCPRRPQGNGQVERVNGVVTPLLAKLLHSKKVGTWDRLLKKIQLLLNTSVNKATGETPIRLLCGYNPVVPDQFLSAIAHPSTGRRDDPEKLRSVARARLQASFDEAKKYYNRRHVAADRLNAGDVVWFSAPPRNADGTSRKLDSLFRGPMVVTRALDHDTYGIVSLDDDNAYSTTAHISQLRLFGHGVSVEKANESVEQSVVPSETVGETS